MAEIVENEVLVPERMHLGAIFGGAFVGLAIWMTLEALWLGIGFGSLVGGASGRSFSIGTLIFTGLAPIIALFVGGMVAARMSGPLGRGGAAVHGLVVWALGAMAAFLVTTSLVRAARGGALQVSTAAAGVAAQGVGSAVRTGIAGVAGVSSDQVLGIVNQRLAAQGKPAVTKDQMDRTIRDIVATAAREGRLDREMIADKLAANTALSRADVSDLSQQLNEQLQRGQSALQQGMSSIGATLQQAGKKAEDSIAKSRFWGFAALVLWAIAAVGGALLGGSRVQRRVERARRRVAARTITTTEPLPSA
jgi:hypothetical protein